MNDGSVKFFLPCEDFGRSPVPQTFDEYSDFRDRSVQFVRARNRRIQELGL